MAAGILLGPSVLGHLWPAAEQFLFPEASLGTLGLLSQLGVLLFMFAVGLELDLSGLWQRARTAVQVSYGGIVTPFILGTGLAWVLYGEYAPEGIRFLTFSLFMGVAMSITAFPVLARILEERNLAGHLPRGDRAWPAPPWRTSPLGPCWPWSSASPSARGAVPPPSRRPPWPAFTSSCCSGGSACARVCLARHPRSADAPGRPAWSTSWSLRSGFGAGDRGHRDPRPLRCLPGGRHHAATARLRATYLRDRLE